MKTSDDRTALPIVTIVATDPAATPEVQSETAALAAIPIVLPGAFRLAGPPLHRPRLRLEYLDGLRGLAALYVVVFHGYEHVSSDHSFHSGAGLPAWTGWMGYGQVSVRVFIVLSGYCLMLPVARSAGHTLEGGPLGYLRRRARRILPAYYAALALSIGLLYAVSLMARKGYGSRDTAHDLSPDAIVSHLLLVHNLNPHWAFRINAPLWSVASEWQIYFLFPLLLLPLWRRFGNAVMAAVAILVGVALHYALGKGIDDACPWFIGLFGLGMAGAALNFAPGSLRNGRVQALPWSWIAALGFASGLALTVTRITPLWLNDTILGAATMALLVYGTRALGTGKPLPPLVRLLDARPVHGLGKFSYSLYLIHGPLLGIFYGLLRHKCHREVLCLVLMTTVGTALVVGASYLFSLAFEKPFLNRRPARAEG